MRSLFFSYLLLFFFAFAGPINAQSILFNEAVSSNSILQDEDGDTPDWFELYNTGNNAIDLENWTVTDDFSEPDKWAFPTINMSPESYLQVWASNKDRAGTQVYRTLINQGDLFRYLVPNQPIGTQWKNAGFDDSGWSQGNTGIGYADGDDTTTVPSGTISILLRKTFNITNTEEVESLVLDIDYDDSFVAYINGVEIARANITGVSPEFNATSITDHEAMMYQGGLPDRFLIDDIEDLLNDGENIFAVQVHNISNTSSDLSIIPFLSAQYNNPSSDGIAPPAILSLTADEGLHTNFKITSAGETLYLFDDSGTFLDSLVIPEMPGNISIGFPFGENETLYFFETLTPGAQNPSIGYSGINSNDIIFSHPGGSTAAINLSLSGVNSPAFIRYTLDASPPTTSSPIYMTPIIIDDNTVVRAAVFRNNYLPSETQTRTYIIDANHQLPVVTLVTDPVNLFDQQTGIYVLGDDYTNAFPFFGANFWEDWERPVHLSFYEPDGTLGIATNAGIKIFGGWSRANNQRSFSLFARNQYGADAFDYPFFEDLPYSSFQALVLRNSGNDWLRSNMRDITLTSLMAGADLEFQAYQPVAVYLNEQYWGYYNIREKVNEHFLASKKNVDPNGIDLLEFDGGAVHGSNEDYLNLLNFINTNDLSVSANYDFVASQVDLENYALYQVAQIYFDNTDWPGNNIKYWRPEGGKWRWILYDTDFGFGPWNDFNHFNNTLDFALEANGPDWPNPPWSTLLFRKLVENITFRNLFVNRFADELNSRFLPDRVSDHIDATAAQISSEVPAHYQRWNGQTNTWNAQINTMKTFGNFRPANVKQHIRSEFNLPAFHPLTIEIDDLVEGFVQVNSLAIAVSEWVGDYFQNVPIRVTAVAKPGYLFSHWISSQGTSQDPDLQINMHAAISLKPVFQASTPPAIVINEINYNSSDDFDTDDWIELYNPHPSPIDLTGWTMKDNDDTHAFILQEGSVIPSLGFIILTKNMLQFSAHHANVANVIGNFDFGLSSENDAVRLYDAEENLVDEVNYLSMLPWPEAANGGGSTLELIAPDLDNSLPENWAPINLYGSPGAPNILVENNDVSALNLAIDCFPNPFSDQAVLTITLDRAAQVDIQIYQQNGALVNTVLSADLPEGLYTQILNLQGFAAGVYWVKYVIDSEESAVLKVVKMD